MIADLPLVSVVDDDESVRESLPDLLRELGFAAAAFASAEAFLASAHLGVTRCVVVDVAMPGMTGPELQTELARRGDATPIVLITAQHDEHVCPHVLVVLGGGVPVQAVQRHGAARRGARGGRGGPVTAPAAHAPAVYVVDDEGAGTRR